MSKIKFLFTEEQKLKTYYLLQLAKFDASLTGSSEFDNYSFDTFVSELASVAYDKELTERINHYELMIRRRKNAKKNEDEER